MRPEPKFFLVDALYERGVQYYFDTWFRGAGSYPAAGEKTTNYLESATAAARIRAHLPRVQLVFILREPARRAYSNWAWSRMNGMEQEDFETALAREDERERHVEPRLRFARPHAYFSRGLYASMLQPYFDLFPATQILCLKFESIIREPRALAARLHVFLGVPARPADADGLDVVNPSENNGETMPAQVAERLRTRYAAPNRDLAAMLGPDFERWEDL